MNKTTVGSCVSIFDSSAVRARNPEKSIKKAFIKIKAGNHCW
jgi:hypothetical protein